VVRGLASSPPGSLLAIPILADPTSTASRTPDLK
jgi:hypothetical protein